MATEKPASKRSYRAFFVVLLLALLAGGGFAAYRMLKGLELKPAPLANVPATATAVAFVRVGNVLQSEALRLIFRDGVVEERLEKIRTDCGIDPSEIVSEVTFFADAATATGVDSVGTIAGGQFTDGRALECLQKALDSEGLGRLRFYDIDGVPAAAPARGEQRVAFLGQHGVAIGREDTLRDVIHVVRDDRPSAVRDPALGRLWERLASGRDVVMLLKLPANARDRLRALNVATAEVTPLTEQVTAIGLAGAFSSGLELASVVQFREPAQAADLARRLREYLAELQGNMLISLTPFGPVVRAVRSEQQGNELTVSVSLPHDRLERLLEFATAWQANRQNQEAGAGAVQMGGTGLTPPTPGPDAPAVRPGPTPPQPQPAP